MGPLEHHLRLARRCGAVCCCEQRPAVVAFQQLTDWFYARGSLLQIKHKYTLRLAELFTETFCWLPLAHCLAGRVLVVHGGLFSRDGVTLDDIRKIDRNRRAAAVPTRCRACGGRGA